jgi:hypothetical protein
MVKFELINSKGEDIHSFYYMAYIQIRCGMKINCLIILLILFVSCNSPQDKTEGSLRKSDSLLNQPIAETDSVFDNPTERIIGRVNNTSIIFEHTNYVQYRLTRDGKVITGELNTERGFRQDKDATVYVLDSDMLKGAQQYFVRYSDGRIIMLDSERKEIADCELAKTD